MARLSERDKIELLADANSVDRQQEFMKMRRRAAPLTPVEWLDFLNQAAKFNRETKCVAVRISGDQFLL